jgi:hypothetical protein
MYSTCLHCHRSLGRNDALEEFPIGRRFAFDSAKGRLWAICASCGRWNLTPIEERWEAVESCERLFRGQRLRAQTDNIGLARLREGTELIRIGSPLRPEFAAWRYGGVFRRRFHNYIGSAAASGAGVAFGAIMLATLPIEIALESMIMVPFMYLGLVTVAYRRGVIGTVAGHDGKPLRVTMANLDHTRVVVDGDEPLRLHLRHSYGRQDLTGDRATRALGTLLTRVNQIGGSKDMIANAAEVIAEAGDPGRAIAVIAREAERRTGDFEKVAAKVVGAPRAVSITEAMRAQRMIQRTTRTLISGVVPTNRGALHRLPARYRLALEMSLHETSEQFALDQELAALQRAWREAEEIAAIADGVLTPLSGHR